MGHGRRRRWSATVPDERKKKQKKHKKGRVAQEKVESQACEAECASARHPLPVGRGTDQATVQDQRQRQRVVAQEELDMQRAMRDSSLYEERRRAVRALVYEQHVLLIDGDSGVARVVAPPVQPPVVASLADALFDTGRPEIPESTIGGQTTCINCFTSTKSHAAVPCGHQCVCGDCAAHLTQCPVCRSPAQMWMHVRIA